MIKVNGNLKQPYIGRLTKVTEPSRMKVCITPPRKELQRVEFLAEGEGNTKWVL